MVNDLKYETKSTRGNDSVKFMPALKKSNITIQQDEQKSTKKDTTIDSISQHRWRSSHLTFDEFCKVEKEVNEE